MKSIKFGMILLMIGTAHFFNVYVEQLDLGQTLEQVESIISQRKVIKTMKIDVQNKKECVF